MILKFPDLATLRLALLNEAVPLAVVQSSATAGFDDQGQVWVESNATLPRANQDKLKKIGVSSVKSSGARLETEVTCWPEVLPLEVDRSPIERLEQTPVLFDLESGEALAKLAIEVLRLGNERQGFRWLEEGKGSNGSTRGLLRVVGPPYYSLLRALDRQGQKSAPVAFIERAPRIWVEVGHNHPLVGRIKAPEGKLILMRPPRQWTYLPDAPFRDLFEALEVPLPNVPVSWRDAKLKAQLRVSPTLRPGGPTEGAELWVLRDSPVDELNAFVQNADDALLQRLSFAVGERGGKKTIVLRVRQSKQAPPVLVIKADAYKHYLKLTNLFLPVGTRLHPPLRRDVVRKLLAEDTNEITWLEPGPNGTFVPQTLPESSFQPLFDWVSYVLDHDKVALQAWVQAAQFDFEPFICEEDGATRPKAPPSGRDKPRAGGRDRSGGRGESGGETSNFILADVEEAPEPAAAVEEELVVVKAEPSELQKQLTALQQQFLSFEGGLDEPDRQALWPDLANLHTALGEADDAGVCWMNALWERDTLPPSWLWAWFGAEAANVAARTEGNRTVKPWVTRAMASKEREAPGEDLDRLFKSDEPSVADVRSLTAYLVWAARQSPPPASLLERLNPLSRFLEKYERLLPVRAVWLAWWSVAQLSKGDVLGLARARDRLLERLYSNGLRPEQDLPSFLRFAGSPTSQRFRAVRTWLLSLRELAQAWVREGGNPMHTATAQTHAYVDLIFAFGLARLGEPDAARETLGRASAVLGASSCDDAHHRLLHLGTHGEANWSRPLSSALVLAQDRLPSRQEQEARVLKGQRPLEGRLTVETVLSDWRLDADLVVLSACRSGLGQDAKGDGMLGFAQAFLQAGARSVVLTRWQVDDEAAALVMVRFYQNLLGKRPGLKAPMGKAEALREAKDWLRNLPAREAKAAVERLPRGKGDRPVAPRKGERPFAHPYYWAAFVLLGDPS